MNLPLLPFFNFYNFLLFGLAQDRRKIARTLLNSTSSRSHSIFNIRLVMAQSREMLEAYDSWPVNDGSKVFFKINFWLDW